MNRLPKISGLLALALLSTAAFGQVETRTVEINNGEVILNGNRVEGAAIPAGFDLRGINVLKLHFEFIGRASATPGLTLGERTFLISDQGFQALPTLNGVTDLRSRAVEKTVDPRREGQQAYMRTVRQSNSQLYTQLSRQSQMDAETVQIARQIASISDPKRRAELKTELEGLLDEIFELRQQSTRGEIKMLQTQIERIQKNLDDRQALKQNVIQERLKLLIGEQ